MIAVIYHSRSGWHEIYRQPAPIGHASLAYFFDQHAIRLTAGVGTEAVEVF